MATTTVHVVLMDDLVVMANYFDLLIESFLTVYGFQSFRSTGYTRMSMSIGQETIGITKHLPSTGGIKKTMKSFEKLAAESTVRYVIFLKEGDRTFSSLSMTM